MARNPNSFSSPGPLATAAQSGGSSALGQASADYLRELRLNNQALDRLAKLSETAAGQTLSRRAYEASAASSLSRARTEAASATAARSYLSTPQGEAAYANRGRQVDLAGTAQSRLREREASLESRRQDTPEYREALLAKAAADAADGLNQLRQRAMEAGVRSRQQQTPEYQDAALARAAVEAAEGLNKLRDRALNAAAAQQQQATPVGRQTVTATVEAKAAESLTSLRQRAAEAQASAQRSATPQGQQEMRRRRALTQTIENSAMEEARQSNTAVYGKLAGGALNAWDGLKKISAVAQPYIMAIMAAEAAAYSFAAAASPSAMKTFNSSMELLSAKIGHSFVPVLDEASRAAQNAGDAWSDFAAIKLGRDKQGDYTVSRGLGDAASWLFGIRELTIGLKALGYDKPGTRDVDLGLQSRVFHNAEDFSESLGAASLSSGANQTSQQVLQEQLKEAIKTNTLLTNIAGGNRGTGAPPLLG